MTAQAQYERDEADNLEQAKEYLREGHTRDCASAMAWSKANCSCEMDGWLRKRSERADSIIDFMRENG